MTENELLDDLATVNTANWDASWAANNTDAVGAAYRRLVAVLTQYPAMREIMQAVASNNTFGASSCFLCGQPTLGWTLGLVHTSECPVTTARALLAAETTDDADERGVDR